MRTMLLDTARWDIILDASGNIAVADPPYALAQDAASAIKLFRGELWYDTSLGVPYFSEVLGQSPPLQLVREKLERAALRVPGVVSATCVITEFEDRTIRGQVQVVDESGVTSVANF